MSAVNCLLCMAAGGGYRLTAPAMLCPAHSGATTEQIDAARATDPGKLFGKEIVDDPVDHPSHYTSHPSRIEAITICEAFNFNIGNAIKYLWRAGLKGDALEDLKKSRWYLEREITRREKAEK